MQTGVVRRISRIAGRASEPLASLLFSPVCWAEDRPIDQAAGGLSEEARQKIALGMLEPYCEKCGSTISEHAARGAKDECPRCIHRRMGLASITRVGLYDAALARLVTTLKFSKRWEAAGVIAPFVLQSMEMRAGDAELKVDLLVPVPLHWRRQLLRGFNQSEEIARALGRLGNWPVCAALRRTRSTFEQSHLQSALQRMENLRGAFVARRDRRIAGKHVWLIDDVCTTGATLTAAARALASLPKDMRPAGIHAAVVCVTDKMSIAHFSE